MEKLAANKKKTDDDISLSQFLNSIFYNNKKKKNYIIHKYIL